MGWWFKTRKFKFISRNHRSCKSKRWSGLFMSVTSQRLWTKINSKNYLGHVGKLRKLGWLKASVTYNLLIFSALKKRSIARMNLSLTTTKYWFSKRSKRTIWQLPSTKTVKTLCISQTCLSTPLKRTFNPKYALFLPRITMLISLRILRRRWWWKTRKLASL